ncbi:inhibitor of trypsin and hageman factor-like [Nymphaea colorata]|uniref:inhibitor of trypsin and hageman factor-like n=1 Tax=Nymphaea colorata TaxID=210225 RepID=UPI00129EC40C|nr:inhibitor of trypsin and hageman factor-like [Nymphaea colorata]
MATTIQARVMGTALLFFFLLSASSIAQAATCKGKSAWPELVGKDGSTAEAIIKAENHRVNFVFTVQEGSSVIQNFDCRRVFVWVNTHGKIYLVQRLG